ncbi:hypothetical protein WJX79_005981 [Trebouxia sp. C0005]
MVDQNRAGAHAKMLKARQNVPGISQIQNYHALSNRVASDMTQIYFDVPKIVHQVWLGETPPPLAWVDSWRHDYTRHCPACQHHRVFDGYRAAGKRWCLPGSGC